VSVELGAAVLLIVVPIGFNLAVFELGRTFDYPNFLRESPGVAGAVGMVLRPRGGRVAEATP
jgi:hypothetical protein